jgi:hypothetical protein
MVVEIPRWTNAKMEVKQKLFSLHVLLLNSIWPCAKVAYE